MSLLDGETRKPDPGPGADLPLWRSRSADDLLASIEPHYRRMGITRVANVTGLDIIGIPVWQAIRPNSRGLAVSQGKGITHSLAKASAVMESIESWHAERLDLPCRIESFAGLAPTGRVIDPQALPLDRNGRYHPQAPIPFCSMTDVATGEAWWIPFELVHTNMVLPLVAGSGTFARNTNGLASGATPVEAVLHALCEVIERDSHTVWHYGNHPDIGRTRIDPAAIVEPAARALLDQLDTAGIDVFLWDLTSDVGVPCVRAVISDRLAEIDLNPVPASGGFGCHPDPRIAMTRAITEAAQSRVTVIAGARDDLTRSRQRHVQREEIYEHWRRQREEPTPMRWDHPRPTGSTVEDDLREILARLAACRLSQVLYLDLSLPDLPVSVARVVVPGAEGPHTTPAYAPGRRARAAAARAAASRSAGAASGADA